MEQILLQMTQKINISGKENIYFLQNIQAYKALYNHLKEMEEQLI